MIQNPKFTAKPALPDMTKLAEMTAEQIAVMPAWKVDLRCEADGAFLADLLGLLKKHEKADSSAR